MKRILLVDSSVDVQNEIKKLGVGSLEFTSVSTLSDATRALALNSFDLLLMDTDLPDGDGFQFCSELRNQKVTAELPVVFVSTRNQASDKVKAFRAGADDYVVKPFEALELEIRLQVRARKEKGEKVEESTIRLGDIELSVPFQKAFLVSAADPASEKDLHLTPTEFRLLYFFIKNEGNILSRSQLLSTIWSDEVHVLARTIDKHISTLKKKLGPKAAYIQSVHSRGYRFIVHAAAQSQSARMSNAEASELAVEV